MKERLARLIIRGRWGVLAAWIVLGTLAGFRAPGTLALLDIRGGSDRPTEASRAEDQITRRFSRPVDEFFAVTLDAPASFDTPGPRSVLDSLARALEGQTYVRGVVSYPSTRDTTFVSRDRRSTFMVVALRTGDGDSAAAWVPQTRTVAREAVAAAAARTSGTYKVRVTGRAPLDLDVRELVAESSRRGERQLIPLTLIILVLAFGALVAALLPLLTGVLAIAISLMAIGVLARHTQMWVFVLNVISMVGLGVGIDYSLLVVTRFREELAGGLDTAEAAVRTMLTAGSAVFTSGLTVAVGFSALLLTPLIETRSVGLGGLIVVTVAVLLSTTLLPALLAILGRNIDRPRGLARRLAWYHAPGLWAYWARALGRHPGRALVLGGSVILLLTIPLFQIRIGLPARNWWPSGNEAGEGLAALSKMGVAGFIQPIRILVQAPKGRTIIQASSLRGLKTLSDSLRADPRVREVRGLVDLAPGTSLLGYSVLYSDLAAARRQYPSFLDAYLSDDGRMALLDVIPADTVSPTTSLDLVRRARQLAHGGFRSTRGMTIVVGGYSAAALDFQDDLLERFPLLVALILAATAIMLAIAFRSVLVPLKAIVMNSLSVAATFGLIVLVFQKGFGARLFGLEGPTSAIFVVVPVLVFAVVFGLSMDYEVFLLSRIKEAYDRTGRNADATMEGVSSTASVITSAALIMILVFGVFAFADVLILQLLGFGLAVAVLLDATVIRMVLVPAFMQLMGKWNWWPGGRRPQNGGAAESPYRPERRSPDA